MTYLCARCRSRVVVARPCARCGRIFCVTCAPVHAQSCGEEGGLRRTGAGVTETRARSCCGRIWTAGDEPDRWISTGKGNPAPCCIATCFPGPGREPTSGELTDALAKVRAAGLAETPAGRAIEAAARNR